MVTRMLVSIIYDFISYDLGYYIDFVQRKFQLLQLRYATLQEECKQENNDLNELKISEEKTMHKKIDKKRTELTEKFQEWLFDREQIAQLKSRIQKKRSTSTDKLVFDSAQLVFENDPEYTQLMESNLSSQDKIECKTAIEQYRNEMMSKYRDFYTKKLQFYQNKIQQMQQQ